MKSTLHSLVIVVLLLNNYLFADGISYKGKNKNDSKDFSGESLYTGDVAFSVPISTIGGVSVELSYNSNVHKAIRADNSIQQAGWVGLGWSLNLGSIVADNNGTQIPNDDKYYYISAKGNAELICQSGNNFILKEYNYWKVVRIQNGNDIIGWEITQDDGTKLRFGNYNKSTGNYDFDISNTKATRFMLGWDGIITNAGNSNYSAAQLIAYQWDISDIEDIAHNHTTINYFQELDYIASQSYLTEKNLQENHIHKALLMPPEEK